MSISLGYKAVVAANNSNQIAVGNLVNADGDNSIQIGRCDHNFLMYRDPAIRNDEQDMTAIADSTLGLDFIDALKPKKFKYSFRDETMELKYPLPHPVTKPDKPLPSTYNTLDINGQPDYDQKGFDKAMTEFNRKNKTYSEFVTKLKTTMDKRISEFGSATGTSIDSKFTYGFISKDVVAAATDPDFNPIHKPVNGKGATYFYPVQLIAPMVTSIQELHKLAIKQREDHDELRTDHNELEAFVGLELTAIKLNMTAIEDTIRKMKEDGDESQKENEEVLDGLGKRLDDLKKQIEALEKILGGGAIIGDPTKPMVLKGKPISLEAPDGTMYTASIAEGGFYPTSEYGAHLGKDFKEENKWRTLHLQGNIYQTMHHAATTGSELMGDTYKLLALDIAKEVRFLSTKATDGLVCGVTADAVEAMLTFRGLNPVNYGFVKRNAMADNGVTIEGVNLVSLAILMSAATLLKT